MKYIMPGDESEGMPRLHYGLHTEQLKIFTSRIHLKKIEAIMMVCGGAEREIRSGLSSLLVIELCGYKLGGGA